MARISISGVGIDYELLGEPGAPAVALTPGGRFPKDIPVGKVHSVSQPPGALQEAVTITPVVDLSRLEFVQVLQWSPQ